MTEITINRTCVIVKRCERFTSGMVGARIKFSFSSEWAGLSKTAVFTNGDTTIDVLNVADEITIPHEVLAISGKKLKVGVYGYTVGDNGNIEIAIPTVYADLGRVVKGADPSGDESTEPSLPVWAQMQSDVSDLDTRVTELEEHGGGGTSDHRQLTNRDAANQHPITAITGLQTALDGKADAADIPSLEGYATEVYIQNYHDNTKQDIITDLATIRSGASKGATAVQPEAGKGLFSGSYNDLTDKPTIPTEVTPLTGTTVTLTPTQVYNAVSAGIPVKVQYADSTYGLFSFTAFNVSDSMNVIVSEIIAYGNGVYMLCELFGDKSSNAWGFNVTTLAELSDIPDIPAALPNPNALIFTGAVTGSYNGSAPMSVNIPSAVTDAHINSLIDTKLGVIENGSY